jgi:hypothetical protein
MISHFRKITNKFQNFSFVFKIDGLTYFGLKRFDVDLSDFKLALKRFDLI